MSKDSTAVATLPHPGGRPRVHDRATVGLDVCVKIAGGMLVKDACAEHGLDPATLWRWAAADKEFGNVYARAREAQAHAIAEDAIRIADGVDLEAQDRLEAMVESIATADDDDKERLLNSLQAVAVQRDRLRVDTRKWLASKIAPKLYGERQAVDVTSNGETIPALVAAAFGVTVVQK